MSTRRNAAANSKVATFFLRLIGFTGWDVAAQGTAAINETQLCEHDGIFAQGKIHLSSQNYFREGYCVHAQEVVWMPQRNNWLARTSMSMPDLSACDDKCLNTANPGIESAMSEANYLLPGAGEIFDLTFTSFSGTGDPTLKDNFFADKTISGDLTVLSELGINTEGLTAGSTVSLNETEFESIASLPTGVIYDVQCSLHHGSGGVANEHQPGSVSDGDLDLHTDPDGTAATDLVILTNCKIDIQGNFRTSGALILTTDTGSNAAQAAISSSADAKIGTAGESCSNDERTAFLAKGRINFAAKLDANNVTFVTTDEVHLASKANDTSYHVRTMILTDSDVHVTSNHVFSGCPGNPPSFIDPEIRVIRFVHI